MVIREDDDLVPTELPPACQVQFKRLDNLITHRQGLTDYLITFHLSYFERSFTVNPNMSREQNMVRGYFPQSGLTPSLAFTKADWRLDDLNDPGLPPVSATNPQVLSALSVAFLDEGRLSGIYHNYLGLVPL